MTGEAFDYIIVGAGTAGCVLANRLSEGKQATVLLLEAGGADDRLAVRLPLAAARLRADPRLTWGFESEPQAALDGRRLPVPCGKLLGGGSSIDDMIALRGHAADYDAWRDQGLEGWGHADVLPYFRRLESHWRGDTTLHGGLGPIPISRHPAPGPLMERARAAARARGIPSSDDLNGRSSEGLGQADLTIARGRRVGTSDYLDAAAKRRNLTVRTGAEVDRVVMIDGAARGVVYRKGLRERIVTARREVILGAGAINSPKLLMLSGIGPADALGALGIAVVADRAAVGANLRDHPQAGVEFALRRAWAFERHLRADRAAGSLMRWAATGRGVLAAPPLVIAANVASRPGSADADIHLRLSPLAAASRVWLPLVRRGVGPALRATWSLNRPLSRGRVDLRSADPAEAPAIRLGLLEDPRDRAAMVRGYRVLRDLLGEAPLAEGLGGMLSPADEPRDDAEVLAFLRASVIAAGYPCGTCRMGADEGAVVDAMLRVRGVKRLRVIDSSIFPTSPAGNSNLPAIMVAEKAADLIRGRPAPPP